jgi:hypothetical protein
MVRLVQLEHSRQGRRVGLVEENRLRLLDKHRSIYDFATVAAAKETRLAKLVAKSLSKQTIDYDSVYAAESQWRLLPAFDHPTEPARCLVTGTGLTHKASALNRQAMHEGADTTGVSSLPVTDSMRMFQWGLEGGRPGRGEIGVPPEWFYKGTGTTLRAHNEPLEVPSFAEDGGEEGEIAGVYLVDGSGAPRRVGFAIGNEFSDHRTEKKNYLYLAPSKLRTCAIGPELIVDAKFDDVSGTVRIRRNGTVIWTKPIFTGEKNMSHTLANLEHHHFKYPAHRCAGDAHIHFFGADAFSFGDGLALENGDVMEIELTGFGRPLRNPIRINRTAPRLVRVKPL